VRAGEGSRAIVSAPQLCVVLPPASEIRLELAMTRYANPPMYLPAVA
jgi:hypothetical protein